MPSIYTPPPLNGQDVLRLVYFQSLNFQRLLTVIHLRVTAGSVNTYASDMDQLAQYFANQIAAAGFWSTVRARQSSDLAYDYLRIQRIAPSRDVFFQRTIGLLGGDANLAATQNVALVLNKRTLRPGRHGRGQVHLPGMPVGEISNGQWNAPLVAALELSINGYLDNEIDPGAALPPLRPCLWDPTPVTGGPQDIVNVVGEMEVKTMHRRTVGLGI